MKPSVFKPAKKPFPDWFTYGCDRGVFCALATRAKTTDLILIDGLNGYPIFLDIMFSLIKSEFYWLDLLVGFGSPILLLVLIRTHWVDNSNWRIFWVGAGFGACWEIPIFLLSKYTQSPIVAWIRYFPVHYLFYVISHTLWDGALFLVGVWLIKLICKPPVLVKFRWQELGVLFAWGQISAFLVEFSAVSNEAWTFVSGYWWNPGIVSIGDHSVTPMMQLIWLVVVVPFYLIVHRANRADNPFEAN